MAAYEGGIVDIKLVKVALPSWVRELFRSTLLFLQHSGLAVYEGGIEL
jgi:hypothetical protein